MNSQHHNIFIIIFAIIIVTIQGFWIFTDARKRGEKGYWLWGIFGLLNFPSSLIVYLIVTRIILDRHKKQ